MSKKQLLRHFMLIEIEQFQQSLSLYLNSKVTEAMFPSYIPFTTLSPQVLYVPVSFPQNKYVFNQGYFLLANSLNTMSQQGPSPDPSSTNILPDHFSQNQPLGFIEAIKSRRKRQCNPQRQRISAKKNSESNIINHYFNYFTNRDCCEITVKRLVLSLKGENQKVENIMGCFNTVLRLINIKRGRMYINKSALLNFFAEEEILNSFPEIANKLCNSNICTVKELSCLLRKSFFLFVREICFTSILTSKRISLLSKQAHIQKRRKILKYLSRKDHLE